MKEKKTIAELEGLIKGYQASYYTGEAEIDDTEFDTLWDELKKIDPKNPLLQKIGSDIIMQGGNFEKVRHIIPMGSQEKAANPDEFMLWAKKMDFSEFIVEYKLDGASLELQYEKGIFTRAVTRGDGEIGDDISENVRKMQGLVPRLKPDESGELERFTGGVRGEVIMSREVHRTFYAGKANCRNAANGLMKRKDGQGSEHLQIICYDAWFGIEMPDEKAKLAWLLEQGFSVVPFELCSGVQEVIDYRLQLMEKRPQLDYDIDGLVVKGFFVDYKDARRARPEKQIAFKFSLEEAVSVVRSVIWSESGATYTPIAEFDPVELAGTRVKRASLVNPNTIRSLGVKIGSHVVITKRGEIIPKIEGIAPAVHDYQGRQDECPIDFPSLCSTCGSKLKDEGVRLFCPNAGCPKRIHHRIEKWVKVLDIRDFGVNLIRRLYTSKRLSSIPDIYTLTEEELASLDGLGEKSAAKIVSSIQSRRRISLAQFIAGFDIEGIGETLTEKLVDAGFTTLDSLFNAAESDIASVYGFGAITAHTLSEGLAECKAEMLALIKNETIIIQKIGSEKEKPLTGKSFCFTGELYSLKRSEAENLVKNSGGIIKSSVVKELSYLVTNDKASGSAKNKKAQELGIPIIDETVFLQLFRAAKIPPVS